MFQNLLPPPPPRPSAEEDSTTTLDREERQTDPMVLVCGPKPFKKLAMQFLDELHYTRDMYYKL
jgi:hypothetical protein